MSIYVIHIVSGRHKNNPSKPPMFVVYEGDDRNLAEEKAFEIINSGKYDGLVLSNTYLRFYDFHLFGGGMRDYEIKGG